MWTMVAAWPLEGSERCDGATVPLSYTACLGRVGVRQKESKVKLSINLLPNRQWDRYANACADLTLLHTHPNQKYCTNIQPDAWLAI